MTSILFGHRRSGSTQVFRSITDAAAVKKSEEPFNAPLRRRKIDPESDAFREYADELLDSVELIKHLWHGLPVTANKYILTHRSVDRVLFLYRRNTVAAAVSRLAAKRLGEWGERAEDQSVGELSCPLIERERLSLDFEIASYRRLVRGAVPSYLFVAYEDIFSSYLSEIFSYFDVNASRSRIREISANRLQPDKRYGGRDFYQKALSNVEEIEHYFGHSISI